RDEAGGSSPPRPTAGPDQRKRWLSTGEGRRGAHHGPHVQGTPAERFSHMDVCPESGRLRLPAPPALWGDPGLRCHGMPVTAGGYAPAAGVVTDAVAHEPTRGWSRCPRRAVAWC